MSSWLGNLNLDRDHPSEGKSTVGWGERTRRVEKIQVQLDGPESDLRLWSPGVIAIFTATEWKLQDSLPVDLTLASFSLTLKD